MSKRALRALACQGGEVFKHDWSTVCHCILRTCVSKKIPLNISCRVKRGNGLHVGVRAKHASVSGFACRPFSASAGADPRLGECHNGSPWPCEAMGDCAKLPGLSLQVRASCIVDASFPQSGLPAGVRQAKGAQT